MILLSLTQHAKRRFTSQFGVGQFSRGQIMIFFLQSFFLKIRSLNLSPITGVYYNEMKSLFFFQGKIKKIGYIHIILPKNI